MPVELNKIRDLRDKAFAQALCFGVLRHYYSLELILGELLHKKIKKKDHDIKALILIGFYQLGHMRIPAHAAVNETVETCKTLKKDWARNMVNATLRNYNRANGKFSELISANNAARYNHPDWMIGRIKQEYPGYWQTIIEENNLLPPMTLRINTCRTSREDYIKRLAAAGIKGSAPDLSENAVTLAEPVDAEMLPDFLSGDVSVQDLGAQLAAPLLAPKANERILDACSAPGGKLAHLLEYQPALKEAVALEPKPERFKKLSNTLARTRLNATLIRDDARTPETWWDRRSFDRILVDAPCSASGIIRRHPDIKYLRTPADIKELVLLQTEILQALWPLLKKGGKLLYATCSIFAAENDGQIARLAGKYKNLRIMAIPGDWGMPTKYGRQILPGERKMDGFYYARLQKI